MSDLFHGILRHLYKFPLDGSEHDLREFLNNKINNRHRPDFARLQQVINFLEEKRYIKFNLKVIEGKNVIVKYGEIPPEGTEEANFDTTYPMASLTLEGHNYLYERNKQKWRLRLYILTIIISVATLIIAFLSFHNRKDKKEYRQEIDGQKLTDSLKKAQ